MSVYLSLAFEYGSAEDCRPTNLTTVLGSNVHHQYFGFSSYGLTIQNTEPKFPADNEDVMCLFLFF